MSCFGSVCEDRVGCGVRVNREFQARIPFDSKVPLPHWLRCVIMCDCSMVAEIRASNGHIKARSSSGAADRSKDGCGVVRAREVENAQGRGPHPNSHAGSKLLPSLAPMTMSDPGSFDSPARVSM